METIDSMDPVEKQKIYDRIDRLIIETRQIQNERIAKSDQTLPENTMTKETISTSLWLYRDDLSSGHYLDRIICLAELFGATDYEYLLRANKIFLEKNHKPDGLEELIRSVANGIMYKCIRLEIEDKFIACLAWAIPYDILRKHDKLHLRNHDIDGAANNM